MKSVSFDCGHEAEYSAIKPLRCPTCRRERNEAMGRAMSEQVRRDKALEERRHVAQVKHSYGKEHERDVCPLCRQGSVFYKR